MFIEALGASSYAVASEDKGMGAAPRIPIAIEEYSKQPGRPPSINLREAQNIPLLKGEKCP